MTFEDCDTEENDDYADHNSFGHDDDLNDEVDNGERHGYDEGDDDDSHNYDDDDYDNVIAHSFDRDDNHKYNDDGDVNAGGYDDRVIILMVMRMMVNVDDAGHDKDDDDYD